MAGDLGEQGRRGCDKPLEGVDHLIKTPYEMDRVYNDIYPICLPSLTYSEQQTHPNEHSSTTQNSLHSTTGE